MRAFASFLGLGLLCFAACATNDTGTDDGGADGGGPKPDASSCGAQTKCGSACVDTTKDPKNCGGCGKACSGSNQYCAGSKCTDACAPPFKLCGQFCVDTTMDHDNCGMCGKACTADQVCTNGTCIKNCPIGLTACGDTCANLATDHDFCGDCNTPCGMNENCNGGLCCAVGQTACMGQCTDLQFSNDNCGQCGYACGGPNPYCVGGVCKTCNPTVLLLMDQDGTQENAKLATALNGMGIPTKLVNNGIESYSGTPDASQFGAIVISGGDDYFMTKDMPAQGQQSIVAAQQKGVGVVIVEPIQFNAEEQGYFNTLKSVFLVTGKTEDFFYDNGPPWPKLTKTANHPVWNNVTAPVDMNPVSFSYALQSTQAASASAIGQCSAAFTVGTACKGVGTILVKAAAGGRIVHFNANANDDSYGDWTANASILKLMTNAVQWASNCQ